MWPVSRMPEPNGWDINGSGQVRTCQGDGIGYRLAVACSATTSDTQAVRFFDARQQPFREYAHAKAPRQIAAQLSRAPAPNPPPIVGIIRLLRPDFDIGKVM